jgi:hypothetical protein
MKLLLRAFPVGFRHRYGDEMLELVQTGDRPLHDGMNLVFAGLRMRFERLTGVARHVASVGVVGAALGSAALGGCLVLGSLAVGGTGALLAHSARRGLAFAR